MGAPTAVVDLLVADDMVERHADLLDRAASVGDASAWRRGRGGRPSDAGDPARDRRRLPQRSMLPLADAGRVHRLVGCVTGSANRATRHSRRAAPTRSEPRRSWSARTRSTSTNAKAVRASTGSLFHLPLVTRSTSVPRCTRPAHRACRSWVPTETPRSTVDHLPVRRAGPADDVGFRQRGLGPPTRPGRAA